MMSDIKLVLFDYADFVGTCFTTIENRKIELISYISDTNLISLQYIFCLSINY